MNARATSIRWTKSSGRPSTFMQPCAACIVRIAPPNCGTVSCPPRPRRRIFTATPAPRPPQTTSLLGQLSCLLLQQTNQGRGAAIAQRRGIFRSPLRHLADRTAQKNIDDLPSLWPTALEVVELDRLSVMRQELRVYDDVAARDLIHSRLDDKA